MREIELNRGFLRWLFFAFKQHIYAELNCFKKNTVDIETVYSY